MSCWLGLTSQEERAFQMAEKFEKSGEKFDPKAENEKYQLEERAEKHKMDNAKLVREADEMKRPGRMQSRS